MLCCAVLSHSAVSDSSLPYGYSLPRLLCPWGFSGKILEGVAMPSSRGSSQPRDQTQISRTASGFLIIWATRETQEHWSGYPITSPGDLPDPGIKPALLHCRRILYQLGYQGSPRDFWNNGIYLYNSQCQNTCILAHFSKLLTYFWDLIIRSDIYKTDKSKFGQRYLE